MAKTLKYINYIILHIVFIKSKNILMFLTIMLYRNIVNTLYLLLKQMF